MTEQELSFAVLLSASPLSDLSEIPVAITGSWVKDSHRFSITRADLDDIVSNFTKRGNGEIVVDFEHASERPEVARGGPVPAAGWIQKLDVRPGDDGKDVLWADIDFTDEAKKLIREKKYRYVSPAIDWGAADKKTGHGKGATLTSSALTNHPFLEELPAIQLSETSGRVIDKFVGKKEMGELDRKRIFGALRKKYGGRSSESNPRVKEIFDDHLVFESGGRFYLSAYTIGANGEVGIKPKKDVNMRLHESDREVDPYHRDPDNPDSQRSQLRRQAERRAKEIDEPASGDGDDDGVLQAAGDGGSIPRFKIRKMSAADKVGKIGHHAVTDHNGKLLGYIRHGDLMEHVGGAKDGDEDRRPVEQASAVDAEIMRRTNAFLAERRGLSYSSAHRQVLASDARLRAAYNEAHSRLML